MWGYKCESVSVRECISLACVCVCVKLCVYECECVFMCIECACVMCDCVYACV